MEQIKEFTSAVELHGYELYELPTGYCERSGWLITGRTVTGELRHYAPLRQFPGLYRTFSSTKEEPTAIKEFANKYGLLGGNIGAIVPVPEEPAPYRQAMGEFLEDWYQEIRSMRRFVSLWDGLLAARKSGLQPQLVVQGSDSFLVGSGGSQIASQHADALLFDSLRLGDTLRPALAYLQVEVNRRLDLHLVVPRLALDFGQTSIVGAFMPDSLLGAIWTDFYVAITEGKGPEEYKTCASCGRFFEKILARRRDAIYCSDACKSKAYRRRM
jgi:hypothetical protein